MDINELRKFQERKKSTIKFALLKRTFLKFDLKKDCGTYLNSNSRKIN